MKSIVFLVAALLAITFTNAQTSIGQDGWTTFNTANADKILYISNSGDDNTGEVYSTPFDILEQDPFQPSPTIKAFKTISAASDQITNGEAAWILLKRGDTFEGGLILKQGLSKEKPFVYASYGTSQEPPLLLTGDDYAIRNCCKTFKHLAVVGLSFYSQKRNPEHPDYDSTNNISGISIYSGGDYVTENILIEGCVFNFYGGNTIQSEKGTVKNIRLRRNLFLNNYSSEAHSQGLYTSKIDSLLLEENIFDHNGWYKQSYTGYNHKGEGQATIFNHDTYFSNAKNTTFIGNSFYRPSSIGTKWTANDGEASSSGLHLENNLYHDCEVAISMGGNVTDSPYRFKDIIVKDNVINSPGLSQQTNRTLGWGIEIHDWDNGICTNNYLVHQDSDVITNARGIMIKGENRNLTVSENILYKLGYSRGFEYSSTDFINTKIKNNTVVLSEKGNNSYQTFINDFTTPLTLDSNRYYDLGNSTKHFGLLNKTITTEEWLAATNETNILTTPLDYVDPTRSLERYISEVLLLHGLNEFYDSLHQQNRWNWRTEYTATAINDWIKEGFTIKSKNIPVASIEFDVHQEIITSYVGESLQLNPFVLPFNASNQTINWSTSNATIASVNQNGLVSLVKNGTVTITAETIDGGFIATSQITVIPQNEEVYYKTVVYKTVNNVEKRMRIYFPNSWKQTDKRAAAVLFHGGSWVSGSYYQMFTWADYLASQGMIGISAEYTFGTVENCILDARSAMRWVKEHADSLGIDSNRVIAGGSSAGAQVAFSTFESTGIDDINDNLTISPKPILFLMLDPALVIKTSERDSITKKYGIDISEKTNPVDDANLDNTTPPSIFFSGTADYRAEETHQLVQKIYGLGVDTEFWLGQNGNHGFGDNAENQEAIKYRMHEFLYKHNLLANPPAVDLSSADLFLHDFAGSRTNLIKPLGILNTLSENKDMIGLNLINDNGFNGSINLNSKHSTNANTMWQTARGTTTQEIIFDMGKSVDFDQIHIWNWNNRSPSHKIGVRRVEISYSSDSTLETAQFQLLDTLKTYRGGAYGQNFTVEAQNARLVKLNIFQAENDAFQQLGFAEVRFSHAKDQTVTSTSGDSTNEILVFPNPCTDKIFFSKSINGLVEMFSATSLHVLSQHLVEEDSLDISGLSNGVYSIKITSSADQSISMYQIIKL